MLNRKEAKKSRTLIPGKESKRRIEHRQPICYLMSASHSEIMNYLPAILAFVFFFFGKASGQESVKKQIHISVERELSIPASGDSNWKYRKRKEYSSQGKLLLELNYCEISCVDTASFVSKYLYRYNDSDQLTERFYYSKGDSLPWSQTFYSYRKNSTGDTLEQTEARLHSFDGNSTFDTSYSTNRFIVAIDGTAEAIQPLIYDQKSVYKHGNLVKVTYTDRGRKQEERYGYDKQNLLVSWEHRGSFRCGFDQKSFHRDYDEQNNIIRYTTENASGNKTITTYLYDENNRRIRETTNWGTTDFFYNENGDLITEKSSSTEGKLTGLKHYTYVYYPG